MTTLPDTRVAGQRRPRKTWDVALTITLLVFGTLFALGDLVAVGTTLLFMDSPSMFAPFAWEALALLVWIGATIASIVLLATGRRAWWLAAVSLVVALVPVLLAVPAFFAAAA